MNQAKAQTVCSALIGAGHFAQAAKKPDGTWIVVATPDGSDITVDVVKTFQDAQAITGRVSSVVFT